MPKLLNIGLHLVRPNPDNPREIVADMGLQESISVHGLYSPLLVWDTSEPNSPRPQYLLLDGHRRFDALQALAHPMANANVYASNELDEKSANFILLEANIRAKSLEPIEEARAIAKRMDRYSFTQGQIADQYGRSQSWVSQRLSLLPAQVRPEVDASRGGRPRNPESPVIAAAITPKAKKVTDAPGLSEQVRNDAETGNHTVTPTHIRELRSAPLDAQESLAKAVEEGKLSSGETRKMVNAVKSAPADRQAEVAHLAAKSDKPVEAAQYLSRVAQTEDLADAKPFNHPDVFEGSWTSKYVADVVGIAAKLAKYRLFAEDSNFPEPVRWDILPHSRRLEEMAFSAKGIIDHFQADLSDIKAELAKRKHSGRPNLRVLDFKDPAKEAAVNSS